MSRTRKDRPYWVVRNNPKHRRGEDHSTWQHHRHGECDIDQKFGPGSHGPSCSYLLAWSAGSVAQRYEVHGCHVPRDARRHEWSKPERNHTRTVLGRARGDWNTLGTIDEDTVPVRQSTRGPWGGGYWD